MDPEICEYCPYLFAKLNSCPQRPHYSQNTFFENIFELLMIFSSAFPYFIVATILFYSLLCKTTRSFFISFLLLFQNFTCESIKFIYEEARPDGSCGKGFGFPSSHASFTGGLIIWLFLEAYFMNKTCLFKKWKYYGSMRNLFFVFSPIILYSRLYLNYHSFEQIFYGFLYGSTFAIALFIYMMKNVISPKFLPKAYAENKEENFLITIFSNYGFKNNFLDQKFIDSQYEKLSDIQKTVGNVKNNLKVKRDDLLGKIADLKSQGY